ncbi:unnamed protein product [Soboliphyme baturini]|uniref:Uncharacterized protein n=1 Tax=Soboliphyme baturini TaxID=241478 RepID=A0A183J7R2_9BILA|nr:unnamed protein product [Soboliphyme baturini]
MDSFMSKQTDGQEATKGSFWNLSFYQRFFDVDTQDVCTRILYSFVPQLNSNFITFHLRPTPDLYDINLGYSAVSPLSGGKCFSFQRF